MVACTFNPSIKKRRQEDFYAFKVSLVFSKLQDSQSNLVTPYWGWWDVEGGEFCTLLKVP